MPCLPEPGLHVTFGSNRRMASSAIARLYARFIIKDGQVPAQQFRVRSDTAGTLRVIICST